GRPRRRRQTDSKEGGIVHLVSGVGQKRLFQVMHGDAEREHAPVLANEILDDRRIAFGSVRQGQTFAGNQGERHLDRRAGDAAHRQTLFDGNQQIVIRVVDESYAAAGDGGGHRRSGRDRYELDRESVLLEEFFVAGDQRRQRNERAGIITYGR